MDGHIIFINKAILQRVVSEGLAKPAGSKQFHVSGKTGTAQISQGVAGYKSGTVNYLVSFCGFFPSEAPKYSCIVSIQKPGLPASGGLMAGSVFGKIAERVYAKNLALDLKNAIDTNRIIIPEVKAGEMNETKRVLNALKIQAQTEFSTTGKQIWGNSYSTAKSVVLQNNHTLKGFIPSVIGMGAKDAVFILESKGLKVQLNGIGKVVNQSIPQGTLVRKNEKIILTLK